MEIWAIWFGQRIRRTRFSHRYPSLLGRRSLYILTNEMVQNGNTFLTWCAGLLNQMHLPPTEQAFIVRFSTEMFGDRLGMPSRSASRLATTGPGEGLEAVQHAWLIMGFWKHPTFCHTLAVPSESIHTPWLIPHYVVLQPEFKIDEIHFFFTHLHTIPHNDKLKTCF